MDSNSSLLHPDTAMATHYAADPLLNRGTAFTREERLRLGLEGVFPPRVESLQEQVARVMANVQAKPEPLEKYVYLDALRNQNETLFYRVVLDDLEGMLPIIYTPTVGQACLEWRLEAMARINEKPIVFALSNSTSKSECTAEQAYAWTSGRTIFASGSPFNPVDFGGRTFHSGQANNSYVFPGVGLGLLVSGSRRATDEMFFAAAEALAAQVTEADLEQGRIFPIATCMRDVAAAVGAAVATVAHEQGYATAARPQDLLAETVRVMYRPEYS